MRCDNRIGKNQTMSDDLSHALAHTAIEAMRIPIEAMRWAGVAIAGPALKESAPSYPIFHPTLHMINEIWRVMIDAALKEPS